jgi:hypothetical protein
LDWFIDLAAGLRFLHHRGILQRNLDMNSLFYTNEHKQLKIGNINFVNWEERVEDTRNGE